MTKLKTFFCHATIPSLDCFSLCYGGSHLLRSVLPAKSYCSRLPIQGFDVSHHQENINWKNITPKISVRLFKSTEGGDYKDPKFQENWLKAREHGFHVGAYHFYRLCRDGKTQAENFIATVLNKADALPPVIDLNMTTTVLILIPKNNYLKK
jgi:lysozyme